MQRVARPRPGKNCNLSLPGRAVEVVRPPKQGSDDVGPTLEGRLLADELGIPNKATLGETANFSAWVKLMRNGIPTDPRPITTEKQYPLFTGRFEAVLRHSQARYARPRKVVEEKLRRFLENKPRTAAAHSTPKKPHYLEDIRNTLSALNDKINAQQAAQQARSLFP